MEVFSKYSVDWEKATQEIIGAFSQWSCELFAFIMSSHYL